MAEINLEDQFVADYNSLRQELDASSRNGPLEAELEKTRTRLEAFERKSGDLEKQLAKAEKDREDERTKHDAARQQLATARDALRQVEQRSGQHETSPDVADELVTAHAKITAFEKIIANQKHELDESAKSTEYLESENLGLGELKHQLLDKIAGLESEIKSLMNRRE